MRNIAPLLIYILIGLKQDNYHCNHYCN